MIDLQNFIKDCNELRAQSPLVLSITNYLAMNLSANSLLAIGASAIMSFFKDEMEDLASICDSLVINIGCLDNCQIEAMMLAAKCFDEKGKPWVLDPVGAGASRIRKETALRLLEFSPSVIRGNASEIACLCLQKTSTCSRGVDTHILSTEVVELAKELSTKSNSVVSMSGAVDIVTDGNRLEYISSGHPLMAKVTAMGCTASALTGAFVCVDTPFEAALNTMALVGVAGEIAAKKSRGTASLELNFVDELSCFDCEEYSKRIRQ